MVGYSRDIDVLSRGARKLAGDNLKQVWAEFSTISEAVMMMYM